jgi:hypothetical protein
MPAVSLGLTPAKVRGYGAVTVNARWHSPAGSVANSYPVPGVTGSAGYAPCWPAEGMSGSPLPVGEQCLIVTWTTEPTGPASGHTVIDESGISSPGALAQEGAGPGGDDMAARADGLTAGAEAEDVTGAVVDEAVVGDVAGTAVDGAVAADAAAGAVGPVFKTDEDRAATRVFG